jgi:hypothetical protein
MDLSKEDQELAAKAIWMTSFEVTLKSCKDMGLTSEATMVGMVQTMTFCIRQLFEEIRKEN